MTCQYRHFAPKYPRGKSPYILAMAYCRDREKGLAGTLKYVTLEWLEERRKAIAESFENTR